MNLQEPTQTNRVKGFNLKNIIYGVHFLETLLRSLSLFNSLQYRKFPDMKQGASCSVSNLDKRVERYAPSGNKPTRGLKLQYKNVAGEKTKQKQTRRSVLRQRIHVNSQLAAPFGHSLDDLFHHFSMPEKESQNSQMYVSHWMRHLGIISKPMFGSEGRAAIHWCVIGIDSCQRGEKLWASVWLNKTPTWTEEAHLQGWTEHMAGGGRCGWFSMVTVFLTWSWLMSSYICSTVSGCLSCRDATVWVEVLRPHELTISVSLFVS